ncbi:site-specific integrase [Parafrankia sp. FMc6]|uniref:tyrosine-type recombinase/integrase n=1 Tax=Parafrankia soli TaxID=2599596 RepID=UPI0034D50F9A
MTKEPNRKRTRRANGQGSIYQGKNGVWVGAAYVLMPDGTRERRRMYGKSEAEVRAKLTAAQSRSDQGIPADATGWTMERYLTYWLEEIARPTCRPRTLQGYEVIVRTYLVPHLGKKRLNKLTGADVRLFLKRVENTCLCCQHGYDSRRPTKQQRCCAVDRCCRRVPSSRLLQQVHSVLRNALGAAVREELVSRNVAKLVKMSGPSYTIHRGLSVDQSKHLLKAATDEPLHALYVLALYYGLRRGELLGLRWEDVDFDAQTLIVRHSLQRIDGGLRLVEPKTRSSERTFPLIGIVATALQGHRRRQNDERALAGRDWVNSGFVFTTHVGTPVAPDNLHRSWKPLAARVGLDGVRLHDLRHTCVTLLLDAGVPPHIVRDIAGHSAIDVTMTIYAHVSLDEKRAALTKLGDRLG